MIKDVSIDATFLLQVDNLIGKGSDLKGDDAPISTDGMFTRSYSSEKTKLSRFSFWTKEKVGSFSKASVAMQIATFIQSERFHTNWQTLPLGEQKKKIEQLETSIITFSKKVEKRLLSLRAEKVEFAGRSFFYRCFHKAPSDAKIAEYQEAHQALGTALETIKAIGDNVELKVAGTKPVGRKLYRKGVHLPRLLNQDVYFQKHPSFITFCSQHESSTAPFIAMVRDMETQGIIGKFNACGMRTELSSLHQKEELALGTIDPEEIKAFNKMCLKYFKETYGQEAYQSIKQAEGFAPYKKGEKVISGQLFDYLVKQLTPKELPVEEVLEAPVEVVQEEVTIQEEVAPRKEGMFSKLRNLSSMTVPTLFTTKEEGSPTSVTQKIGDASKKIIGKMSKISIPTTFPTTFTIGNPFIVA